MKKRAGQGKRRILAWALSLVMVCSLVSVPMRAEAESDLTLTISGGSGTSTLSDSTTNVDINIAAPSGYNTVQALVNAGYTTLQIQYEVTEYTQASTGTAGIQAYFAYGDSYTYCTGGWTNLSSGTTGTLTLDLSSATEGTSSTLQRFGAQIANVTGTVTYSITSAKLIYSDTASGSSGDSGSTSDFGVSRDYSSGVTATVTNQGTPSSDWSGFDVTLTNNSGSTICDWIIELTVPSGAASAFKCWNATFVADGDTIYLYPMQSGDNAVVSAGTLSANVPGGGFSSMYVDASSITVVGVYYNIGSTSSYDYSSGTTNDSSSGTTGGTITDSTTDLNLDIEYNYAKLLQESLYFYDANMCGPDVGETSAFEWRDDCHTQDKEVSVTINNATYCVDVSGGFHDAGDHVKFGLPQGYAATMLGLSYYEFKEAFTSTGQEDHLQTITDYFCDYFKRCTVYDSSGAVIGFCYQVGDGNADHAVWSAPESESQSSINRPAYFATSSNPATDEVSLAIAALAINYLNFGNTGDLDTAKALFTFVDANNKTCATDSEVVSFYSSSSWQDDYCTAAYALYLATKDSTYLSKFNAYYGNVNTGWVLCWDNTWGVAAALKGDWNSAYSIAAYGSTTTAQGFKFIDAWGSARYNTAEQFLGLVYDKNNDTDSFGTWATGQMKYLLGNNSTKRCFIVGYNENSSKYPHHRAASNSTDASVVSADHYTLLGALVGGPSDTSDSYNDSQADYQCNEVALDYNATLVGAAAGLYLLHKEDEDAINTLASEEELSAIGVTTYYGTSSAASVASVTLEQTTLELVEGATATLTAIVKMSDDDSDIATVSWSSSDTSVATVSGGMITAIGAGTATITAKAGGKTATCQVTVTAVPAAKLEADSYSVTCTAQQYGYTSPAAATVTISNTGTAAATGVTATLSSGTAFSVSLSSSSIDANGTASLTITPQTGLSVGAYSDTVTVSYDENKSLTILVSLQVTKAARTDVPASPQLDSRTSSSLTVVSQEGCQYSKNGGETWQDENTFTGLSAFTGYQVTVRYGETDYYYADNQASAVTMYTLVENPYVIDVSKLDNADYVAALCTVDSDTTAVSATVSYDSSTNTLTLSDSSQTYTLTGSNTDLTVKADAGTDITLNNAAIQKIEITNTSGDETTPETTLTLTGDNTVTQGITSTGKLTIASASGDSQGSLTVNANSVGIQADKLVIEGGILDISAGDIALSAKQITITGGTVTAAVTSDNIAAGPVIGGSNCDSITLTGSYIVSGKPEESSVYDFGVSEGGSIVIDGAVIGGDPKYSVTPTDSQGKALNMVTVTLQDETGAVLTTMQVNSGTDIVLSELNVKAADGETNYADSNSGYALSWSLNGVTYELTGTISNVTADITLTPVWTWITVDLSGATVTVSGSTVYTGSALTPSVKVVLDGKTLTEGTDYTVTYSNNVNPGTATVVVTGKGGYTGSAKSTFTITKAAETTETTESPAASSNTKTSVADLMVEEIETQGYTGAAVTPDITVLDGDEILSEDIDYTVAYRNNINVGTATAVITGKGDYTGTKTVTFTIAILNNAIYTVGNYQYKVTKTASVGTGTVSLVKAVKKKKTVTVPAAVKIGGISFTVTEIGAGAFKGDTKLTTLKISKSVTKIGANAFYGCTKLKTASIGSGVQSIGKKAFYNCKSMTKLTISSKKLKKSSVGAKAFTKMGSKNYKKLTVKVPKAKLKTYKKLLKSKGLSKKATVK